MAVLIRLPHFALGLQPVLILQAFPANPLLVKLISFFGYLGRKVNLLLRQQWRSGGVEDPIGQQLEAVGEQGTDDRIAPYKTCILPA